MVSLKKKVFIACIVLCFVWSSSAQGAAVDEIMEGMSYGEVITLLGAPEEKREYEVKREAIWFYKDGSVRFREGKVVLDQEDKEEEGAANDLEDKEVPLHREEFEDDGVVEEGETNVPLKDIFGDVLSATANKDTPRSIRAMR